MAQRKRGENLQELVSRLLEERQMSGRELAKQAAARGHTLSYSTINGIKNGTRANAPTLDTLAAIADVFGLPENDVRQAAGVPPRDDSTDPEMLALHRSLSPQEKAEAVRMYRQYVRSVQNLRRIKGDQPTNRR